jgi:uncharacterized damage-inducible protein DinB
MSDQLKRMLRYDTWANQETVQSLRQDSPPARSLRWMGHIIGAELLWLSRMEGKPAPIPVWPELSLDECSAYLPQDLTDGWSGPLTRRVSYTNSKGEAWSNTVEEILTHLVIHSAYHRGQIASDLRAAGLDPAYTDYIHAVRQSFVE